MINETQKMKHFKLFLFCKMIFFYFKILQEELNDNIAQLQDILVDLQAENQMLTVDMIFIHT